MRLLTIGRAAALGILFCAASAAASAQDITVRVNGETVSFPGTQPREVGGRVLVPLRGVLEDMGAHVRWRPDDNTVVATRGQTRIVLPIGRRDARVDGRRVRLDVPAMIVNGSTMVPLRFVSESLGAEVHWRSATRTVAISTSDEYARRYRQDENNDYGNDRDGNDNDSSSVTRTTLPVGTVIPVKLQTDLSSNDNREGDAFTATVDQGESAAGLPDGTRFEGVVTTAIASTKGKPGVLQLDVRRVIFPDGTSRAIDASITSLDAKNVERGEDGRLRAKATGNSEQWKWVGIGAGAGYLISSLTNGNRLVDALLGAGAGYLYNALQKKGAGAVHLDEGTEFGVRLDRRLAFSRR
ncbi:MAG: copper amine oxidase N-terminal domain-containing protein [Chthonomonadales bacterium]|nr:copper amine oxidase N-terminal domain-containing protein [Chthonomonadales bacterium]